jgi:hypothetical protein
MEGPQAVRDAYALLYTPAPGTPLSVLVNPNAADGRTVRLSDWHGMDQLSIMGWFVVLLWGLTTPVTLLVRTLRPSR